MSWMAVGIPSPDEGVEAIDLGQTLEVANRAIKNDTVARLGEDRVAKVVSDQGPIVDLSKAIGDIHIAALQSINGPRIHGTDTTFPVAPVKHATGQFRACRHILRGKSTADHGYIVVNRFPVALELGAVAVRAQEAPCFFDRDLSHSIENRIGDFGAAVGKPVPFPFGCEENQLLAGDGLSLNRATETQDNTGQKRSGQRSDVALLLGETQRSRRCLKHV